jgi:hypothetical protein
MVFFPSTFIALSYIVFFIQCRKKYSTGDSAIFGYLLGSIFLIIVNKFFLYLKIIFLYKYFLFLVIIFYFYIIFKNKFLIKSDFLQLKKVIFKYKNKYLCHFLIFVFLYSLIQSIFVPPTNFDSLMYNITRNYFFSMENSIYPVDNTLSQNSLIMPFNSDLQFLTHAIFNSDYFMNVPNFFGLAVSSVVFFKILKILKIEKEISFLVCLLFLSSSNVFLGQFNTKNDLQVSIYFLMILYFLFQIMKGNKNYIPFGFLSIAFVSGIKWTTIFFLVPVLPIYAWAFYKNNFISISLKSFALLFPALVLILPIDIAYFNFVNTGTITGATETEVGNLFLHNDGFAGMLANLIRYFIMSIDLTFPTQKLGLEIINSSFDKANNYFQLLFFSDNALGIADFIKDSVFFNYEYVVRPHSDFAFFGIFGVVFFVTPIVKIFYTNNNYEKILCFLAIFFITSLSYKISWFPWNARYVAPYFIIGCLLLATFKNNVLLKNKSYLKFYIMCLTMFNLFAHIPQPLFQHSLTESWLNVFHDRENFKRFAIPEIKQVKQLKRYIDDGDNFIVMMNNNNAMRRFDGPFQSNYQILREFNKSYIKFVDERFRSFQLNNSKHESLSPEDIGKYKFLINFSKRKLENENMFILISKKNKKEYEVYLIKK